MATPTKISTTARAVRMDDDVWDEFGAAAERDGGRSVVIRRLVRLWMNDPVVQRKIARMPDAVASRNPSIAH